MKRWLYEGPLIQPGATQSPSKLTLYWVCHIFPAREKISGEILVSVLRGTDRIPNSDDYDFWSLPMNWHRLYNNTHEKLNVKCRTGKADTTNSFFFFFVFLWQSQTGVKWKGGEPLTSLLTTFAPFLPTRNSFKHWCCSDFFHLIITVGEETSQVYPRVRN